MTLQEIVQRLRRAGLKVSQKAVFGRPGCVVYSRWEEDVGADTVLIADVSHIWRERGVWYFRQWREGPLPGPDDIEFDTLDGDELVDAVLSRYQGEATELGHWLVPLHRHPEWDLLLIRNLIDQATQLDKSRWHQVLRQHQLAMQYALSAPTVTEEEILRTILANSFSFAASTREAEQTLFIRRDLGAAYIVPIAPPLVERQSARLQ